MFTLHVDSCQKWEIDKLSILTSCECFWYLAEKLLHLKKKTTTETKKQTLEAKYLQIRKYSSKLKSLNVLWDFTEFTVLAMIK